MNDNYLSCLSSVWTLFNERSLDQRKRLDSPYGFGPLGYHISTDHNLFSIFMAQNPVLAANKLINLLLSSIEIRIFL